MGEIEETSKRVTWS